MDCGPRWRLPGENEETFAAELWDRGLLGCELQEAQDGKRRATTTEHAVITVLVTPEELARDAVEIHGDAYRHLFRARRLAKGVQLRLVDGEGRARWFAVRDVERRRAVAAAAGEDAPTGEPAFRLELLVAALRPERAGWLVEKATEIGASAIRFLASERTPRDYSAARLERLRRVAAAAVEQCHRARLPEVTGIHPWDEVAELIAGVETSWFLDLDEEDASIKSGDSQSGAVLVGPEGGWSVAERRRLRELGAGAVSLGERVLRVETAAVAAAALVLLPAS